MEEKCQTQSGTGILCEIRTGGYAQMDSVIA